MGFETNPPRYAKQWLQVCKIWLHHKEFHDGTDHLSKETRPCPKPLYSLVNVDSHNGREFVPLEWVVESAICKLNNQSFFHCSSDSIQPLLLMLHSSQCIASSIPSFICCLLEETIGPKYFESKFLGDLWNVLPNNAKFRNVRQCCEAIQGPPSKG